MPMYRDGWTMANQTYMLSCAIIGADLRGDENDLLERR